jgi:hypothetical protein
MKEVVGDARRILIAGAGGHADIGKWCGLMPPRLQADFNGVFGDVLCLSHTDSCRDETGAEIELRAGMEVVAFDEDIGDRGERVDIVAAGTVEPAPPWLACKGSRWVLRIDSRGVRHEGDVDERQGEIGRG